MLIFTTLRAMKQQKGLSDKDLIKKYGKESNPDFGKLFSTKKPLPVKQSKNKK